jgi:hypothetical protein
MNFEISNDGRGAGRHVDLNGALVEIDTRGDHVILDLRWPDTSYRSLTKYDRTGLVVVSFHLWNDSHAEIARDNLSYSIDGVARTCIAPVWHVSASDAGELVVLDPASAPDPTRNLYRYNTDGSLRWQMGPRDFRPDDLIYWGEFSKNGDVVARANMNGWTGKIDDRTGAFVRVLSTEEK